MEMGDSAKCIEQCDEALGKRYDVKADYEVVAKVSSLQREALSACQTRHVNGQWKPPPVRGVTWLSQIYNRMAACYQRQKDYTNAISCLEKSLCEANTRQTRALLAEVKRLKDHAERESYINPEKAEEHRLKGNELFKNNQFPDAKKGKQFDCDLDSQCSAGFRPKFYCCPSNRISIQPSTTACWWPELSTTTATGSAVAVPSGEVVSQVELRDGRSDFEALVPFELRVR